MSPLFSPQRPDGDPASVPVRLATLALAVMPLAMWLANRSAPLMLALAALACLFEVWREGRLAQETLRLRFALRGWTGLASLAFLAYALLSLAWSHRPAASLAMWFELAIPLASGLVVALFWPQRAPRWAGQAMGLGVVLAALLSLTELQWGTALREAVGLRPHSFVFNRTVISLLLPAIPLVVALLSGRVWLPALGLAAIVALAAFVSESGAARLGVMAAAAAALAAWFVPRLALGLAASGLAALLLIAPIQGEIADRLIPQSLHAEMQQSHSRDRVDIWLSFGEAIRRRPLFGAGFGTSGSFDRHPVAAEVPEARRMLLAVGHPHSAEVQIWAELGVAGAILLLWGGLAMLARIRALAAPARVAPLAALAAAVAIAAVGHGAWQGWWIAVLAATVIWSRWLARKTQAEAKGAAAS